MLSVGDIGFMVLDCAFSVAADTGTVEAAPLATADVAFALTEWAGLACGLRLVLISCVHASE